ncbi:hypothetical protein N7504_005532 [Penicillium tannophilum]|nr:hypothetical protein N7504_005532 [Penicillium tannophilum]
MSSPTHTIDPDGEVIIILLNANSSFAQLDEDLITSPDFDIPMPLCDNAQNAPEVTEGSETPLEELNLTAKQRKAMKKKREKDRKSVMSLAALAMTSPNGESAAGDVPVEAPPAEEYPAEDVPAEVIPAEAPVAEEHLAEEPTAEAAEELTVKEAISEESFAEVAVHSCFRIQVSAKHLTFASPVFKKLLTGGWKESITYFQKGSVEITAETWDIDALMIVLQAIHGQHYLMPETLTLDMLAKVAVIADYYDCKNSLYLLKDKWIENLEEKVPTTVSRNLVLWLWIAWFFERSSQFKLSTCIAMSQSNSWIDSLGLPIPDNIIDTMNQSREKAIESLIVFLHETRDAFLDGPRGCSFECRSIMYGSLTKHMQSSNLLLPKPEAPFPGLNYGHLVQKAMSFTSPKWFESASTYSSYGSSYGTRIRHTCDDSSFESVFAILKDPFEGLELNRFTGP